MPPREKCLVSEAITVGAIAQELGVRSHRVEHVIRTRPHIVEVGRCGGNRLFDRKTIRLVRDALAGIDRVRLDRLDKRAGAAR